MTLITIHVNCVPKRNISLDFRDDFAWSVLLSIFDLDKQLCSHLTRNSIGLTVIE